MDIKNHLKCANVCMSSVLRETIQEYMYKLGFLKKRLEHYSCWTTVFALSKAEI